MKRTMGPPTKLAPLWGLLAACATNPALAADAPRIVRNIVYREVDNLALKLDVYQPLREGRHPAVVLIHGGAWCIGTKLDLGWCARMLAENGYVAFAISYRLAPRYRHPAQLEDCREAVRWVRRNAEQWDADPARIAALGYSAGGHLALMLAVTQASARKADREEWIQAASAGAAPCDLRPLPAGSKALRYWLGATPGEDPRRYAEASPITHVNPATPPVFLYHGADDRMVPPRQTEEMAAALRALHTPVERMLVAERGHITAMFDEAAMRQCIAFFNQHLRRGGQARR